MFRKWIAKRLDKLLVYGATRSQIEKAVRISGHTRDVINVERLGFLENAITCKWGTSARGLIPELGPHLPRASFSVFYPRLIRKKVRELLKSHS